MDFPTPNYFHHSPPNFESNMEPPLEGSRRSFYDPLCKLNLKETSDFVKSLPIPNSNSTHRTTRDGVNSATRRRVTESPSTPGRPVLGFISRKNVPSKWDEAQKWLVSSPSNHSFTNQNFKSQTEVFAHKFRVSDESVTLTKNNTNPFKDFNGVSDFHLKDKFMDNVEPVGSIIVEIQHRDIGTEMSPLGSSTTSRCPTPFKSTSPARHNTPSNRSGLLGLSEDGATILISQLQECHLSKLHHPSQYDSVASNWNSREEEEEEVSKSLRHFETGNECRKSISDSRAAVWEEEKKTKYCNRYEREEAKIEAWVNLQKAKAEAQSKKLEVKIERMRSNLEEKLMKRLLTVHRKAEELREAARQQHSDQIHKVTEQQGNNFNSRRQRPYSLGHDAACGCFPSHNTPTKIQQ